MEREDYQTRSTNKEADEKTIEPDEELEIIHLKPNKIKSYLKFKEDVNKILEIQLIPFDSRVHVPEFHNHIQNMSYHLRFYFPKKHDKNPKYDHLFVMFNGLAEAMPWIYDDIGLEFAKHCIPSVLFPITNHLCRRKNFNCDGYDIFTAVDKQESILTGQEMIIEIAKEPERIIYGYIQMMRDVDRFMKSISNPDVYPAFHKFYHKYFDKNAKICLLGYSLGGIIILALLLKNPDKYHSVYLLESGANFSDINAGVLFERKEKIVKWIWERYVINPLANKEKEIDDVKEYLIFKNDNEKMKKKWEAIEKKLKSVKILENIGKNDPFLFSPFVRSAEEANEIWDKIVLEVNEKFPDVLMSKDERDIFEKIVIGNFKTLYKEKLSELYKKILIFLGGIDVVFTAGAIQSFAPEKTGLAIVQIPGLGHWLKFSSGEQWLRWKEFITKTIINFYETVPDVD